GAVDDDPLAQRHEIPRSVELANDDVTAPEEEFAHQRVKVDVRLDPDRRIAYRVLRREGMLARSIDFSSGVESGVEVWTLCGAWLPIRVRLLVAQGEVVEPGDTEVRTCHQLQLTIGDIGGPAILRIPLVRAAILPDET